MTFPAVPQSCGMSSRGHSTQDIAKEDIMRMAILVVALTILVATGCQHNLAKNGCSNCGGGLLGGGFDNGRPDRIARVRGGELDQLNNPANGGPPSAATAYPYYSIRSPRDFLVPNPPSIGY